MKKIGRYATFITCGLMLSLTVANLNKTNKSSVKTIGDDGYQICLDSTNTISSSTSSYSVEQSGSARTLIGNSVTFKTLNVLKNNSGWQTIMPGGYFYNPVTNTSTKNKISGIKSIRYTSPSSNSLSLYYGDSINGSSVVYSNAETVTAGTTYTFSDHHPAYIYLKNESASNISITDLNIEYSCSAESPKTEYNILMIGNSFSDDTIYYAARVAASYGITLNIYDAYIASCTIATHYTNLTSGATDYSMRSMNGSSWNYQNSMTLPQIINSHTWDIVTFQQASAYIGKSDSYANLSGLVSGVRNLVGSTPKFYWYQTWAYDSDYHDYYNYFAYFNNDRASMFNAIINCYNSQVAPLGVFEKMIPAGTAVENMRTSYMGETFTRDGKHMSSAHGRYLLAVNFISHALNISLDMSDFSFVPTEINSSFKLVVKESVRNARKTPLAVTNSAYTTTEMANYDLSSYTEIDAGLLGCSYWNSTDSSNYNNRIMHVSGTSNLYCTTSRFTSSTLPVGSLVFIGEAFGVRPEAWTSDAVQSTRPGEVYDNVIEITSSFWSGYQYRAFNIFKGLKSSLSGQYAQVFDNFHIYVPNSALGTLKPKTYNPMKTSDTAIFTDNLLNIDAFERIHLDPITGFYKCDENVEQYVMGNKYVDSTAQRFVCTRPFYTSKGDLPENTVIIVDSGYQWRSDCWTSYGVYNNRPGNVTSQLTRLDASFMSGFRRRTFNVSKTDGYTTVGQNALDFMNHLRIYVPISDDIEIDPPEPPTPVEWPEGTFRGTASVMGNSFPIMISIGNSVNGLVGVRLSNNDAGATGITYNSSTKAVSITTTGSYSGYSFGTITATYDPSNVRLTNVTCNGSISSYVSNNGSITATRPSNLWECNGTTSELQSTFKRRYMSGSWQVDTGNSDRITSNTTEYVSGGGAVKRRGWTGGAVALNFNADFSPAKTVSNVYFWVYNPSGSDISLRMWGYKATNFGSNFETGSVTAKAGKWTYLAMGFTSASIYNFQIADFNNTGTYLTFDDICLV